MGSLERVPCLHVDKNNLNKIWPIIVSSIDHCHWIGLDLELTGIGSKTNFGLKEVSDRYSAFAEVAKTRGIVAIGLSTFQFLPGPKTFPHERKITREEVVSADNIEDWSDLEVNHEIEDVVWPFVSNSFNILSRCTDPDIVMEEDAKTFLENHAFDFERQSKSGIEYSGRHVSTAQDTDLKTPSLKNLFSKIIQSKKPIVLHNGWIDLLFLYQHLFLDLPEKLDVFLANCFDLFPSGVYDTKYIAEQDFGYRASFLEFLYYFRQRNNVENMMGDLRHIFITFPDYSYSIESELKLGHDIEYRNMKTKIMETRPENLEVCKHYGYHGWCADGSECKKSHNIDFFLDIKREKELRKTRKRMTQKQVNDLKKLSNFNESLVINDVNGQASGDSDQSICLESVGKVKSGAHQSGYDAFMTAFVFGTIICGSCFNPPFDTPLKRTTPGLKDIVNNLFLSGKTYPLKVRRGHFDPPSKDCQAKLTVLREAAKHESIQTSVF